MASQHATDDHSNNTPQDGSPATPSAGDRGQVLPLAGEEGPALRELDEFDLETFSKIDADTGLPQFTADRMPECTREQLDDLSDLITQEETASSPAYRH
jgi:hypothetical protein